MKRLQFAIAVALIPVFGCTQANQEVPRGVDQAGVWEVGYFTDSFGDPTDQPFLIGTINGGEYSGVESTFWWGNKNVSGEGSLTIRYHLTRTGNMIKEGRKEKPEEVPVVDFSVMLYKSDQSDTTYRYSNLWKSFNDWDIKVETESMDPFIGRDVDFESNDYRWLTFYRSDAEKIMDILSVGSETVMRAQCKKYDEHDEYSFSIDADVLKDLPDVLAGYLYHYSEYQKAHDTKSK